MVSKNRYRTVGVNCPLNMFCVWLGVLCVLYVVVACFIGQQYCNHVISLFLLLYVTSLIFISIRRIIPCSSLYGITVLHRSQNTMCNSEEAKRTRQNYV